MPYADPKERQAYVRANRERRNAQKHAWIAAQPPEYQVWGSMKARCHIKTDPAYPSYGKRGVKVCSRWRKSFAAFLADMGSRPSPAHTIDRWPDNDGDYEPDNCRWATRREQAEHRPGYNRILTLDGKSQCVSAWARELGVSYSQIHSRLSRGATDAEALAPTRPEYLSRVISA